MMNAITLILCLLLVGITLLGTAKILKVLKKHRSENTVAKASYYYIMLSCIFVLAIFVFFLILYVLVWGITAT